eukprot:2613295-Pyramimonas_sp.AAC.1
MGPEIVPVSKIPHAGPTSWHLRSCPHAARHSRMVGPTEMGPRTVPVRATFQHAWSHDKP